MKKKVFNLFLMSFVLIILTGCSSKKAITTDKFIESAKDSGFETYDVTTQFKDTPSIDKATVAKKADKYQIEFYILKDSDAATLMFNQNKVTFETYKGLTSTESKVNLKKYTKYSLTSNGYYMDLSRIDNTLLYVRVEDKYKNEVKKFIKEIGY